MCKRYTRRGLEVELSDEHIRLANKTQIFMDGEIWSLLHFMFFNHNIHSFFSFCRHGRGNFADSQRVIRPDNDYWEFMRY